MMVIKISKVFFTNFRINRNQPINPPNQNNNFTGPNQATNDPGANTRTRNPNNRGNNNNGFQAFANRTDNQNNIGRFSSMFASRREAWE